MSRGRPQKVADLIQREIADLLRHEVRDPRVGMVTLTSVDVAPETGVCLKRDKKDPGSFTAEARR